MLNAVENKDDLNTKRALIAELLASEVFPASPAQQGLWIASQMERDHSLYNIPVGLRLRGPLRAEILERSLQAVVDRHGALRTTFELKDDQIVQRRSRHAHCSMDYVDLSGCSDGEVMAEAHVQTVAAISKPMDLSRGPLFSSTLLKLRETDHILICNMHHIISDAWSAGILVRELTDNYLRLSTNPSYVREPLELQYSDFTIWLRDYYQTDTVRSQVEYWKKKLKGSPPLLNLPSDRSRGAEKQGRGARQTIRLQPSLIGELKAIAARNQVTFFVLMLAAFKVFLYRYSGQADILVGVPVAGRNQIETESMIGLFVNTIVLRSDLSGNPKFGILLQQVQDTTIQALANQDVSFDRLVEELQPVRSFSYNPLFQVMFTTFKAAVSSSIIGDLEIAPHPINTGTSRFDLNAALIEGTNDWWFQLEYSTSLFDDTTISNMLANFRTLLCSVAGIEPSQA